ncbi:SMP-30/gluconolactonase/LRE family protein [Halobacteria archaeon HArc-gm2]|nr:SMP-30/gluconolactonase/LRE family protein [Halobacteria archaeon HArc-gm2]
MTRYERVADYRSHTGEGPLWHPDEERLYWVDIPNGDLFRYDPDTDEHEQCFERDVVGGFTIQDDGSLLLFEDGGRIERWVEGAGTTTVVEGIDGEADSRFNDVVADPRGRVFCGTMPTDDRPGRLYRLDTDGSVTTVLDEVGLPNGMGFTLDRRRFYFTDSGNGRIDRYDYDQATGAISNPETVVEVDEGEAIPDGMAVDAEGYLWSARWDGGCLVRHDPTGAEVARIEFPARKVSSVTFAGPDLSEAYVTTALTENSRDEEGDGAGALFRFDPDAVGVPEFRSRVEI